MFCFSIKSFVFLFALFMRLPLSLAGVLPFIVVLSFFFSHHLP
uniref:Uncharacterized protein n=1 Tax=Siphoviridae sp. ctNnX9 TaxID=2827859 RepID=A0A8S5TDP6_9CAUD|nr:MAG TPA: hypothetical protein [Siphoviridae sp. ctNnX9]